MFSDEVLEKIFMRKELQKLDLQTQSSVIHAIEEVLEEENYGKQSLSDTYNE
jgi:hypothetical protein|nr:MAG TPA: hypothetical protein [Bacteriophage sp.]